MIAENKSNYRVAAMTDGQYMQVETAAKLKSAGGQNSPISSCGS
jgi:ABC-type thiamine transport system substrate-binding protein